MTADVRMQPGFRMGRFGGLIIRQGSLIPMLASPKQHCIISSATPTSSHITDKELLTFLLLLYRLFHSPLKWPAQDWLS